MASRRDISSEGAVASAVRGMEQAAGGGSNLHQLDLEKLEIK
jgi:hypothetical protein